MKRSTIILSIVNVVGILWALGFVWSSQQLATREGRDYYEAGDSIGFIAIVGPVLLLCFFANFIWAAIALVSAVRRQGYQSLVALLIVVALWIAAWPLSNAIASLPAKPLQRTGFAGR